MPPLIILTIVLALVGIGILVVGGPYRLAGVGVLGLAALEP